MYIPALVFSLIEIELAHNSHVLSWLVLNVTGYCEFECPYTLFIHTPIRATRLFKGHKSCSIGPPILCRVD